MASVQNVRRRGGGGRSSGGKRLYTGLSRTPSFHWGHFNTRACICFFPRTATATGQLHALYWVRALKPKIFPSLLHLFTWAILSLERLHFSALIPSCINSFKRCMTIHLFLTGFVYSYWLFRIILQPKCLNVQNKQKTD